MGRPREQWSAVPRVGQPFARPASKPHGGPRDCPRGRSRFVSTRTDSWAYGYGSLLIFAEPDHQKKKANRVHPLRPVLAPTSRGKPKIPCTLPNYSLLQLSEKLRA